MDYAGNRPGELGILRKWVKIIKTFLTKALDTDRSTHQNQALNENGEKKSPIVSAVLETLKKGWE